jgi:putative spermidine/putrescine transport system permease protein
MGRSDLSTCAPKPEQGQSIKSGGVRWLLLPTAFTFLIFGSVIAFFLWKSLLPYTQPGQTGNTFTLENYSSIFSDAYYIRVLWQTVFLAFVTVLVAIIVSFPVAYCLARSSSRWVHVGIGIILASMTMSLVIRALGWIGILDIHGPLNAGLMHLGITTRPLRLLGESSGIAIGLIHAFVPLMTLTLLPVMQSIDPILEDAASGLGAGSFTTFRRVILPLAFPGTLSAGLMAFAICMGSFTTPALLGGGKFVVFAELIQEQIGVALNYPLAAALAATLTIIVLILLWTGASLAGMRYRMSIGG